MSDKCKATRLESLVKESGEQTTRRARPTGRVSKQQWLDAALEALSSGGVEAVRVVDLAKALNISKSGFYWHFESREHLLEQMKQYWITEYSSQIIEETLQSHEPLVGKLTQLVGKIRDRQAGKYDLAFTAWAARNPSLKTHVDHVRDMRITFIKTILAEEGYRGDDLEGRARLFLVYFSWSEVMFQKTDAGLKGEPLEVILNVIAGP
jgi:AcrR family transcriptional regulator